MDADSVSVSSDEERISLVVLVSEAASNQAKITNRLWLAVIAVAVAVFLPTTPATAAEATTVQLPFGLGAVPPTAFYPVVFAILSVLAVALAAAHAQQIRADRIAHHVVTALSAPDSSSPIVVPLHMRDLLDILRHPSFTRVAPLAQVITGHYPPPIRADRTSNQDAASRGCILAGSYLLLKSFALIVLFMIPMAGIVIAYRKVAMALDGWLLGVLTVIGLVALLSLLAAAIVDSILVVRLAFTLLNRAK